MPPVRKKAQGPTITVKGKKYDVNADFSWRELVTVEDLAKVPLAADGAFDHMIVGAAFIFVVLKREQPALEWDTFLDGSVNDVETDGVEDEAKRPTKAGSSS